MVKKKIVSKIGFTLIELLVVVTILAVLSLAGMAAFRNAAGNARDARRKADVDAVAKAMEANYQPGVGYPTALKASFFTNQKIYPQDSDPSKQTYSLTVDPNQTWFKVCAVGLEINPSEVYCRTAAQADTP